MAAAAAEEDQTTLHWITAEDDSVCGYCDSMAGYYEPNDINLALNFPPVHARCRCELIPE